MSRWWWWQKHPPACTCVQCNERRLRRIGRRPSHPEFSDTAQSAYRIQRSGLRRSIRRLWGLLSSTLLVALGLMVLASAGLLTLHLSRGAEFDTGIPMVVEDYRVVLNCPGELDVIRSFVDRSPAEADIEHLGDDWVELVCQGALVEAGGSAANAAPEPKSGPFATPSPAVAVALPTPPRPPSQARSSRTSVPTSATLPVVPATTTETELPAATSPAARTALEEQLPRTVFEEFEASFYSGCLEPPLNRLAIARQWSARGPDTLRFIPPNGSYFLVLTGEPSGSGWRFDSTLEDSRGRRHQSLHIDGVVPDDLTDAQKWCSQGSGVTLAHIVEVDAANVAWTVYLIEEGPGEELPRQVLTALTGYYGSCPPMPAIDRLEAQVIAWSSEARIGDLIAFVSKPPHYFLAVQFQPSETSWYFRSVDVRGDWRTEGPRVQSDTRSTIDFTAICPTSPSSHHLDMDWSGGEWVLYLITVAE